MAIEPESLIGIVAPQIGIYYERIIYFGILPIILGIIAIQKTSRFWLFMVIVSIFFSLGMNTPFYSTVINFSIF